MNETHRRPRAIPLPADIEARGTPRKSAGRRPGAAQQFDYAETIDIDTETAPPAIAARKRWPWATVFLSALGGLAGLAIAIAIDDFVRATFARNDWLGWAATALAALTALALLALVLRELATLLRQRAVRHLRERSRQAHDDDDVRQARRVVTELQSFYSRRADQARGRNAVASHVESVFDGADLIVLCERELMSPLDAAARGLLSAAARRVAVVTAVSPRAIVDIAYVLYENLRLIGAIATVYGGRPTLLGLLRLARNVVGHLAATGAMAVGENMLQQLVGHGLAARLSARLGEGVVNGLMTARIGIAAMDICRPMPFFALARPRLSDLAGELAPGTIFGGKAAGLDKNAPPVP